MEKVMNEILQTNKQIAIYARVSSSNQENEGTIETQLSAIYEYAKTRSYLIIQEYLDNGWSGDSIVRPELDRLRVDAKKKLWDTVLIYDPDRLARRYSYQELVMDELRDTGIEVIFVTTPAPSNSIEKILYGVQGLFAEYERAKITERFRLGKVRKANEGHVIASEAPYGYTFIPKHGKRGDPDFQQGYYQINDYEAENVKLIFSWVAEEGLTIRAVVKRLQEKDIPPRKSKRGVWNTSTLCNLLRNKTYIGEGHFGASYAVVPVKPIKKEGYRKIKKTSRRNKPEQEWIKIPTPKIIDEDLFFQVQQRLKANFESSVRNTKNEYLLTSKIWCSCGKRRTGEGALHGKHLYYRCTNRVYSFPLPPTCTEKGISARVADDLVWQQISSLMSSPQLLAKQADRWLNSQQNKMVQSTLNQHTVTSEINKLKDQEDRFNKAYGAGLISIDQLKEYLQPIREKNQGLKNQVEKGVIESQKQPEISLPKPNEIEIFAKSAADLLSNLNFEAKKAIIKNVIEKITATPKELLVYGNIPINNLNHGSFCSIHRNSQNTMAQESDLITRIPFEFSIEISKTTPAKTHSIGEQKEAA
jgi:site-specific DNA recombinase